MPQTIKADELMTQQYKWIDERESLGKALSSFNESCDVLLVQDEKQQYSGILTERMILRSGLDRAKTKVKALKRHTPKISSTTLLPEIAGLMVQNDLLHLPVFQDNKVVGIIDDLSILTSVVTKDFGKQNVRDFMSNNVHTITPQEKIAVCLHNFRDFHIGRLPVVENEKVIGMITLHDVVTRVIQPHQRTQPEDILHEKIPLWDLPVEGIMSEPVITSQVNMSIMDVINKMVKFRVSGVPILDEADRLVGIVTKKDILGPLSFIRDITRYPIIQFSSKLHGEYEDDLRPLVEQFAKRHEDRIPNARFVIYLREFKPEIENLRSVSVRCRLYSDFGHFAAYAESRGPHNAMKQVLILLERQLHRKISEKREFSRLYKKDYLEYVEGFT